MIKLEVIQNGKLKVCTISQSPNRQTNDVWDVKRSEVSMGLLCRQKEN